MLAFAHILSQSECNRSMLNRAKESFQVFNQSFLNSYCHLFVTIDHFVNGQIVLNGSRMVVLVTENLLHSDRCNISITL